MGPAAMQVLILEQRDGLAAYVDEILRTWGLLGVHVAETADAGSALPLDPARTPTVVCPRGSPEPRLHEPVLEYARAGGTVLTFLPQGAWAKALGLGTPRPRQTPLRLRLTARPAAGLDGELLPVVGSAMEYEWPPAAAPLAYLSVPGEYEGEIAGIVEVPLGAGRLLATAFDLPLCILLLRQGDPARAEKLPAADPCARPSHLAADFDAGDAAWVPFADLLGRWLVDEVRHRMPVPVPLIWHLPGAAPGILLYSGDEDHADIAWNVAQMEHLQACGARMNLYIIPERTHSTAADVKRYRQHHDVGPHPDLRHLDGAPVAVRMEEFARQILLFETRYGVKARSLRNHCTAWAGYLEPVETMARLGVRLDGNFFSGAFLRGRVQAPYAAFGGAMPMRFCQPTGSLLPVFQQHTPLADDVLFGSSAYSYKLSPAAFSAMSGRILDDMVRRFHTPYAVCVHPSNWVRFSGDQGRQLLADAQQRGVPVWSFDQWLEFWEARDGWRLERMRWDGRTLEWIAGGQRGHAGLVLAVPATHGALRLATADLDGLPALSDRQRRYREDWVFAPVPDGKRTVRLRATYAETPARPV